MNTFDPNGVGSYTCTCAPGYSGKNCDKRIPPQAQTTSNQTKSLDSKAESQIDNSYQPLTQTGNNQIPVLSSQIATNHRPKATRNPKDVDTQAPIAQQVSANVPPFVGIHHYPQPIIQQQQSIDHWVLAAYITIIICMVILVVLLLLRIFFERTSQRQWSQESSHVEDVATLQNHQNIYKSRTSLSTEKVPYDTVDGGSSTSNSSGNVADQTHAGIDRMHTRHYNHSYHNLQTIAALNPPPPYPISQSHPNSAYNNSTYGTSIYNDTSTNRNNPSNASTATNTSTNSYIYTSSASLNPYGHRAPGTATSSNSLAATNPYGSTNSTYQSPCYVIAYHIQS